MRLWSRTATAAAVVALQGCSTTQDVTVARAVPAKVDTIAQVLDDGNSPLMSGYMAAALQRGGLTVKATLPMGTRTAPNVDALISYVDVWRWDLAMYMKNLTVRLHDARTGNLVATGHWSDSALHGFRDAGAVMEGLVAEVLAKVQAASANGAPSAPADRLRGPQPSADLTAPQASSLPAAPTTSPQPMPAAPPRAIGQESHQVARMPEVKACNANPDPVLIAKAGSSLETYAVACTAGSGIVVTCEWGSCRVAR